MHQAPTEVFICAKKILVGKFAYVVRMHYFCRRKHEIGAVVQFG